MRASPGPAERRWVPLYRAGAVSAAAAVLLYAVALVIVTVSGQPPNSRGVATLRYVEAHRTLYIIRQVLWQAPSLFMMVVILALAVALGGYGPNLAVIAATIGVSSCRLWLGTRQEEWIWQNIKQRLEAKEAEPRPAPGLRSGSDRHLLAWPS